MPGIDDRQPVAVLDGVPVRVRVLDAVHTLGDGKLDHRRDVPCRHAAKQCYFGGSVRAYAVPIFTHCSSSRFVRRCSSSTRSQPCISRPRISISFASALATKLSDCVGSHRTSTPPWPLAAIAMLPPTRNARPPNI